MKSSLGRLLRNTWVVAARQSSNYPLKIPECSTFSSGPASVGVETAMLTESKPNEISPPS